MIERYRRLTEEELWENLRYFLEAIIPVAEKLGIRMAIHPDDPPWSVFGLPRIMKNREDLRRRRARSGRTGADRCGDADNADAYVSGLPRPALRGAHDGLRRSGPAARDDANEIRRRR